MRIKRILFFTILLFITMLSKFCFSDEYYIGQWKWVENEEDKYWIYPHQEFLINSIDLRSIPQCEKSGGTPEGYGIFVYSQKINDPNLIYLGDNPKLKINKKLKDSLSEILKISDLESETIEDIIWEKLTIKADPTGVSGPKPLTPKSDRKLELNLGRNKKQISLIPFISKEWNVVLRTLQNDYKELISTENIKTVAKVLDYWEKQFGVPYHVFIPQGEIKIASLPHETIIVEDWNCSDSDSITCDLTWTETLNDLDIASNRLRAGANNSSSLGRAETDLSSSNNYAQIKIIFLDGTGSHNYSHRPGTRWNSSANTFYAVRRLGTGGTQQYRIERVSSGTATVISGPTTLALSLPETWKIEANGSTITAYLEGVSKASVTDTNITSGTRAGVGIYSFDLSSTEVIDDFEAGDISISPTSIVGASIIGASIN